jgi:hypothetical protein
VIDPDAWIEQCQERLSATTGAIPAFWLDHFLESLRDELNGQLTTLDGYLAPLQRESFPFT